MHILKRHRTLKLSLVLICLTGVIGLSLKGRLTHEAFDSDKWKNWVETEETWSLRWDMMNDLRNTHDLSAKNKAEIIDLLGNPDSQQKSEFGYTLGYSRNGINTGFLTIEFDSLDNVIGINVREG